VPRIGWAPTVEVGSTIRRVSVGPAGQTIWKDEPAGSVENGMSPCTR
jgi:hypothetical protein